MAKGGQGPKVAIAVALFLVAGGVIAWQMGWLGGGGDDGLSDEERAAREAEKERMRQLVERGEAEAPTTRLAAPE